MVKVKILYSDTNRGLEYLINNFFENNPTIEVVDVKYQIDSNLVNEYNAIIIYKV